MALALPVNASIIQPRVWHGPVEIFVSQGVSVVTLVIGDPLSTSG